VVQEFKHRGLKRLFKPITSTAYKKLITQFYKNLSYGCTRPGVLFSSIQDNDIKVTSSNIVVALKCKDEHPLEDAQLDEQLPTFYVA
jgi:hypothetical protein